MKKCCFFCFEDIGFWHLKTSLLAQGNCDWHFFTLSAILYTDWPITELKKMMTWSWCSVEALAFYSTILHTFPALHKCDSCQELTHGTMWQDTETVTNRQKLLQPIMFKNTCLPIFPYLYNQEKHRGQMFVDVSRKSSFVTHLPWSCPLRYIRSSVKDLIYQSLHRDTCRLLNWILNE